MLQLSKGRVELGIAELRPKSVAIKMNARVSRLCELHVTPHTPFIMWNTGK